jgi:hypothetical protein
MRVLDAGAALELLDGPSGPPAAAPAILAQPPTPEPERTPARSSSAALARVGRLRIASPSERRPIVGLAHRLAARRVARPDRL